MILHKPADLDISLYFLKYKQSIYGTRDTGALNIRYIKLIYVEQLPQICHISGSQIDLFFRKRGEFHDQQGDCCNWPGALLISLVRNFIVVCHRG